MKFRQQSHGKSIVHLVLLPLVFFVSIPAFFVKENLQDIAFLDWSTFAVLAVIATSFIFALLGMNVLFRKKHLSFILGNGAEFLMFFVVVSGFVLPSSISTGMVDAGEAPINSLYLVISLLATTVLIGIAKGPHRQTLYLGLVFFVVLNTALSGYAIVTKVRSQVDRDQQPLYEISDVRNIFVLSFDGLSGSAVTEVLNENTNIASQFYGFTFFNRVASSSPATSASIAASLYGNKNFKDKYQTEQELWDSSPKDLLTNYLNDNGYKVSTFGEYGKNFDIQNRSFFSSAFGGVGLTNLINFTIARTFTGLFVIRGESLNHLERVMRSRFGSNKTEETALIQKISSSNSPSWKNRLSATMVDLERYIADLKIDTSEPIVHFLHFTFTHFPVEFDQDCHFLGDDPIWYFDQQNRNGVKEETICALSKFSEFIIKLKTLGVFEKSMVVLKSDHGKPVSYYNSDDIGSLSINGHLFWGYGRYKPFLAIKSFGPVDSNIKENLSPVLLDDLAKTICVAALSDPLCTQYPGFDILDESLSISDSEVVTLFVVRSKKSDFRYNSHKAITVKRQPDIVQNLYDTLTSDD